MLKMKTELQKYLTYSYLVPKLLGLLTKLLQLTHFGFVQAVTCWLWDNFKHQTQIYIKYHLKTNTNDCRCVLVRPTGISIVARFCNPVIQESTFIKVNQLSEIICFKILFVPDLGKK